MKMKNMKIILSVILICAILAISTHVFAIIAQPKNSTSTFIPNTAPAPQMLIISKGLATILKILQVLQYVIPAVFFVGMIVFNIIKKNKKNNVVNIIKYFAISVLLFFAVIGLGTKLLNRDKKLGYSSKTTGYIEYNGEVLYYHK